MLSSTLTPHCSQTAVDPQLERKAQRTAAIRAHNDVLDAITNGHYRKPQPLRGLTPEQDAELEVWWLYMEASQNGFLPLASRVSDCTPRCRDDCPQDGFHGPAATQFDRSFGLMSRVQGAIEMSGQSPE